MGERGLNVVHSTVGRWVLRYAPELSKRVRRELRTPNRSWRVDETYVRVAGRWTYLYRAVDSAGETIDFMLSPKRDALAAKRFLQLALWRAGQVQPRVINVDGHASYPTAIKELKDSGALSRRCQVRPCPYPGAGPSFREETDCRQSLVPISRWCVTNDPGLRGDEHDPQGTGELAGKGRRTLHRAHLWARCIDSVRVNWTHFGCQNLFATDPAAL